MGRAWSGSKGDGKTRPLGIPVVKDRIVQTAVKLVIEPIFEAAFHPASYGFRPGRGCQDALREVQDLSNQTVSSRPSRQASTETNYLANHASLPVLIKINAEAS